MRLRKAAAALAAALFALLWTVYSLMHVSPYAASWDEVDFVLALDRFDLLAMQPHFPGYPYFVLGGMAMRRFAGDNPVLAYGILNTFLAALSAWPVWRLARRMLSPAWACTVVMLVLSAPYVWLQDAGPMSEGAGIALLWWFLWSWQSAMERRDWRTSLAALFVFGLLMGVRLSYAPFGLALVWLLGVIWAGWRAAGRKALPRALLFTAAGAGCQLLWLGGLALSEGGLAGFAKLAEAFTAGHFSEWGGGVAADPSLPFGERLLRFAGGNVLWTGMFARSAALMAASAALLLAALLCAGARRPPGGAGRPRLARRAAAWLRRPAPPGALAALAGAYGAWALLAQNIDKPRHITPLIGVMWLLLAAMFRAPAPASRPAAPGEAGAALPPAAGAVPPACAAGQAPQAPRAARIRRALRGAGGLLAACVIALQAGRGASLVSRQAAERPAVYQLADALREMAQQNGGRRIVVYTWEEDRVLDYLRTPVEARQILTYDYFRANTKADGDALILLTDHVLGGFEAQAGPLRDHVKPIRTFRSDPLFEPVYADITLYEWKGG